MLRGVSLISLMSISIVWGTPTQEQLEEFVRSQGDGVEVKYTPFCAIEEIKLKNKKAKQAFLEFVNLRTLPSEQDYSIPPSRETVGDVYDCFLRYSRKASREEMRIIEGFGVSNLRIIDFDSILLGLETHEREKVLALKRDGVTLIRAIDEFIDRVIISPDYRSKVYTDTGKGDCPYLLSSESIRKIRLGLRDVMRKMTLRKSSLEMLILSLALLDHLALTVDDLCQFMGDRLIQICLSEYEDYNIYRLYRELNHAVHYKLGILGGGSFVGNLDSKLEQGLFRFPTVNPEDERQITVPLPFLQSVLNENWGRTAAASYVFPRQWLARLARMALLWDSVEGIRSTIGYCSVFAFICCNHFCDMSILLIPLLLHVRYCKFTDIPVPFSFYRGHLRKGSFFQKLEHEVTDNPKHLYPKSRALKAWMRLLGLDCKKVKVEILINKTPEEVKELVKLKPEDLMLPTEGEFEVPPSPKRRAVFAPSEN